MQKKADPPNSWKFSQRVEYGWKLIEMNIRIHLLYLAEVFGNFLFETAGRHLVVASDDSNLVSKMFWDIAQGFLWIFSHFYWFRRVKVGV